MSIYDEVPTTKDAIITFKAYAKNQIKVIESNRKKLENFIVECDRRLDEMEKSNESKKTDRDIE